MKINKVRTLFSSLKFDLEIEDVLVNISETTFRTFSISPLCIVLYKTLYILYKYDYIGFAL